MKTNELRIGNCILIDCIMYKEERKVTEICPDGVFAKTRYTANMPEIVFIKEEDIEPIELTEELLVKIGFEKGDTSPKYQRYYWEVYSGNGQSLRLSYDFYYDEQSRLKIIFRNLDGVENEFKKYDVKYLHQLQNAYYCLTGQELEIEL